MAAYEEGTERPRVHQDGTIGASIARSAEVNARVTALETLGLLLAAGLGEERHMEALATEMLGEELPIRSVVLKSFLLVPGKLLVPHISSCATLFQASHAAHSRDRALAVLRRASVSAVHDVLLEVQTMHEIDDEVERYMYSWCHWTMALWTLTVVPGRLLVSHHLITIARASRWLPRPEHPSDAYQQCAPQQALRLVLKALCDVDYEGHEDCWSKTQIEAVVAMLTDGDGGVGKVLRAIHPGALVMAVPALLDVALDGSLAASTEPHEGVLAAIRSLNTFAYKKSNSKSVGPPPAELAQRIIDGLTSADAADRAAAANLVGRLHRPLAHAHYPRLWELLDDDDERVRGAAVEALGTGAGALEVKDRMGDIQHELSGANTSGRALQGLLKVLECLRKPWSLELLPSILSLTLHPSADIATAARTALESFHGIDIHTHLPAFLTPPTTATTTDAHAHAHKSTTDTSAPPTTATFPHTHHPTHGDIPASTLLSILDLPCLRPHLHNYAHVIAQRLSHDSEPVRDTAMALLHHVDIAARRPHLKAIATACVQPRDVARVKPVYVQVLRVMTSGLTTGDLEAVVAALSDRKRILRALTVLRPLATSHPQLLREIAGPIARCLDVVDQSGDAGSSLRQSGDGGGDDSQSGESSGETDGSDDGDQSTRRRDDNVVRVMAMRVLAEAEVKELGKHEVLLLAKVLLHVDDAIRREAVRLLSSLQPESLEPLAGWLLDNLLRSPPYKRGVVKSLREVLVKLPEHCMRRRVTELVNALEMPSPVTQATAFDIMLQMKEQTLQHAMAPLARILTRPNAPAEIRAAAIRIASRVPCETQTCVLAAAVIDGIGNHEHESVREAALQAIKSLSTKLVQENARELIHAILTIDTPEVVKRAATDLRNRTHESQDVVVPHLDMSLKLMLSDDESEEDDGGTRRREVGFAFAKVFPVMCLEAHTEAVQKLLQHEHVDVRRNGFALVSAAYEMMYGYSSGRRHVYRDSHWLLPPLAEAVADALIDTHCSVRVVAKKAMGYALEGATTAKPPIDKITAALLRYGHEYTGCHTTWYFVCAARKELAVQLVEGDDATRLCILRLLNRLEAFHAYLVYEREKELCAAAAAIPPDASMSVQVEAAKLLRHADPVITTRFPDGYVDPGFLSSPSRDR